VWKRLKKKDLTSDDFCKGVKKVGKKLVGSGKIAGLKPHTYNGEETRVRGAGRCSSTA
jgi:hypothetical protein